MGPTPSSYDINGNGLLSFVFISLMEQKVSHEGHNSHALCWLQYYNPELIFEGGDFSVAINWTALKIFF